jgi:hypothetical protein
LRRDGDGYIYFVLADEVDRVKIGYTNGVPEFRVEHMRTGSPVELAIARVIYGHRTLERELHAHFRDRRVNREWFEASVLDDIDEAVLEITGYRADPPSWANPTETNPTRNPTPLYIEEGFQGLAANVSDSLKERPSRAHSSSLHQPAVAHGRDRVGGNAQTEETP